MRIAVAVSIGLLCCCASTASVADSQSTQIEKAAKFIVANVFPPVDAATCVPLYESAIAAISDSQDINVESDANAALELKHCLDAHSHIQAAFPLELVVGGFNLDDFRILTSVPLKEVHTFVRDIVPLPHLRPKHGGGMPYYGNYAYLRIDAFSDENLYDFRIDVRQMLKHRPTGIILDLRDNPGGRVSFAKEVLNAFAPKKGLVAVTEESRDGIAPVFRTQGAAPFAGLPIAILVNGGSASASEMVSSVLRRWFPDSTRLIGSHTYGKGTMQIPETAWEAPLGIDIILTFARYYPGKDTSILIDGVGLEPDIKGGSIDDLKLATGTLDYLQAPLRLKVTANR